jgi:hypothetical protein
MARTRLRPSKFPLSYLGDNPVAPPNVFVFDRAPTTDDKKGVYLGDFWIHKTSVPPNVYMLVGLSNNSAAWSEITTTLEGGTTGQLLTAVTGSAPVWATESDGDFSFVRTSVGDRNLTVSSSDTTSTGSDAGFKIITGGSTGGDPFIRYTVTGETSWMTGIDNADSDKFKVSASDTDLSANVALKIDPITQYVDLPVGLTLSAEGAGVVQTSAAGLVSSSKGTDGQVLISSTAGVPSWATLTEGSNINITTGPNSIEIASTASGAGSPSCAFLAYQGTDGAEPNGGVLLGEDVILTEVFDVGSDFYPGDGSFLEAEFTAPVDGKYLLTMSTVLKVTGSPAATVNNYIEIITSSHTYRNKWKADEATSEIGEESMTVSVVVNMTASDTATFNVVTDQSAGVYDIYGDVSGTGEHRTFVSGVLLNSQAVAEEYETDYGSAVPSAGKIKVLGGAGIATSASSNEITITNTGGGGGGGTPSCVFLAHQATNGGIPYTANPVYLGEEVAMTEVFDVGSNFDPGDGGGSEAIFTAPADGKYLLTMNVLIQTGSLSSLSLYAQIETTGRKYRNKMALVPPSASTLGYSANVSVVADMTIGQTAKYLVYNMGASGYATIQGDDTVTGEYQTFVSGVLLNTQNVAETYQADSGTASPSSGTLNVLGTGSVATTAAGSTVTIAGSSSRCSFLAHQPTDAPTYSGGVNYAYIGEHVVLTEIYDVGGDLFPGDGAGSPALFTAPVTGKYLLQYSVRTDQGISWIKTSNRTYYYYMNIQTAASTVIKTICVIADMDAGDTATFGYKHAYYRASGDLTGQTGIWTFLNGSYQTYISGVLL